MRNGWPFRLLLDLTSAGFFNLLIGCVPTQIGALPDCGVSPLWVPGK